MLGHKLTNIGQCVTELNKANEYWQYSLDIIPHYIIDEFKDDSELTEFAIKIGNYKNVLESNSDYADMIKYALKNYGFGEFK
jgi:hypothetical protein